VPSVAIIGSRGYPSYYGGFETLVRRLAPHLADAGWDVTVYGRPGLKTDDPDLDPRVRSRVTAGIESKKFSTLSYGLTSTVDAFVRKPDVALVLNCAVGYWLPILKARGIPSVVNVDGIEWERGKWGRSARAVFRTGAKLTARYADELVFDARAIGAYWRENFGRDGVFIPYGGDPSGELPVEPGLEHGKYVLIVARFVAENTINEFVDAAQQLAADHDVVFVGSSGYGGEIEERVGRLAASNPRVHWFGHVKDDRRLHSLWQHAGAYFHGHSVGGTNPALVQAMALGAPIVARDTVYNREVLGGSGLLVPPEPDRIAEAADRLVRSSELRALLGGNALARAADAYTWEGVCERYESALWALATRTAGSSARPVPQVPASATAEPVPADPVPADDSVEVR
jgi:glycosyltransferase involved in cell wall biosynthesis